MKTRTSLSWLVILAGLLGGCAIVSEGPRGTPPPADAAPLVRGVEPQPQPIPQKTTPDGQSSLRKTSPDQPLVPPTPSPKS